MWHSGTCHCGSNPCAISDLWYNHGAYSSRREADNIISNKLKSYNLDYDIFKSEIIKNECEELISDDSFRKNSKSIGDKLKSFNGIDCILDVMNENSF
mgnify:CR=1 FL=1